MTAAVTVNASQYTLLASASGFADHARIAQFTLLASIESGGDVRVSQYTVLVSVLRGYRLPIALGHTFTSQVQIARPPVQQESATRTGPSQGKLRRAVYAAPLLVDAQGVSMGVDFLRMRPIAFPSPNTVAALPLTQTFSGVILGLVDAESNYDNMWCWEITRPYPCTLAAVEVQHTTNENV